MRTLKRSDTWNATTNQYHYPQTPSRIMLSLWPAGSPKNGKGTIEWAGGFVDWTTQDVQKFGYYYAMVKDVKVDCYDPPKGVNKTGDQSYIYISESGLNNSVAITDDDTVLQSLLGTGTDMDADYPDASDDADKPEATKEIATVPGLSGAGPGTNGHPGNDGSTNTVPAGGSSGTGSAPGAQGSSIGGFSQGRAASATENEASNPKERGLQSSIFAALVAVLGLLVL